MKLCELLHELLTLDETDFIYAEKPWSDHSPSIAVPASEVSEVSFKYRGDMEYFCEAFALREYFGDEYFRTITDGESIQKIQRVIHFATHDA